MPLDLRDRMVQDHAPTVMVPSHSELQPLASAGHRYLAAGDGIWLEVRRPWLHLTWPILAGARLPYGEVRRKIQLEFKMPVDLIAHFVDDARRALPDEAAAWIVWNELDQRLEYVNVGTYEASPGGIRYARPRLEAHQHLAIDLHSHGAASAFFSATDNEDDAGEVKIAGVIGSLAEADKTPSAVFRLCALGVHVNVGTPAGFRSGE